MTGRRQNLAMHLQFAVPLRMAELADVPHADLLTDMQRLWPTDPDGRREPWVQYADALLYAAPGPQVRDSLRALVTGLAVAALVSDGGVTFDGLHWCTNHTHCLEVRDA